jgi:hypothetical protein
MLDLPQLGQNLSALETDISPALSPFKPIFFSISLRLRPPPSPITWSKASRFHPGGPGLSVTVCTKCDLGLQNADHTRQRRPIRVTTRQPVVFRNQIGKRPLNRPQPCSCFQPFHQLA